jgi:hypothetical protein
MLIVGQLIKVEPTIFVNGILLLEMCCLSLASMADCGSSGEYERPR